MRHAKNILNGIGTGKGISGITTQVEQTYLLFPGPKTYCKHLASKKTTPSRKWCLEIGLSQIWDFGHVLLMTEVLVVRKMSNYFSQKNFCIVQLRYNLCQGKKIILTGMIRCWKVPDLEVADSTIRYRSCFVNGYFKFQHFKVLSPGKIFFLTLHFVTGNLDINLRSDVCNKKIFCSLKNT